MEEGAGELDNLSEADLQALRLGSEIMGHKATLENRPLAADYFQRLEDSLRQRLQGGEPVDAGRASAVTLQESADAEDRRLVLEYLELLAANERLSPALREACRRLRESVAA